MKYLIRSIKYFFYLAFTLALIIFALVAFKVVEWDPENFFVNGYDSYWQIALMMALFAALYPKMGFATRKVTAAGEFSSLEGKIDAVMQEHGYELESRENASLHYRKKSRAARIPDMWEDGITISPCLGGMELEGLTRRLPKLVSAIETKLIP